MSSNQHLTYNRLSAHLRPLCNHDRTSSSTPTPVSHSQVLRDTDVFATLLFDRQKAYRRSSSTILASHSSSQSKVKDTASNTQSLAPKQVFQSRFMLPQARTISGKQKKSTKGKKETKNLLANQDTKLQRKVTRSLESAGKTASQGDIDTMMISSDEEELQELHKLRNELRAANARIKQLEDLLETKQAASFNGSIEQEIPKEVKAECGAREPPSRDPTWTEEENKSSTKEDLARKGNALTVAVPSPLTTQSSPSSMLPPVSPYLSGTISNKDDLKLENIRMTYTKVKRKLDTLNVIIRKLDWCTKSMDLSNFGEFGVHMKQLRQWLEDEQQQQQQS